MLPPVGRNWQVIAPHCCCINNGEKSFITLTTDIKMKDYTGQQGPTLQNFLLFHLQNWSSKLERLRRANNYTFAQ
jgi:hypothetical protein